MIILVSKNTHITLNIQSGYSSSKTGISELGTIKCDVGETITLLFKPKSQKKRFLGIIQCALLISSIFATNQHCRQLERKTHIVTQAESHFLLYVQIYSRWCDHGSQFTTQTPLTHIQIICRVLHYIDCLLNAFMLYNIV